MKNSCRKAQSSLELLITLSFGLMVLLPIVALAFVQMASSTSTLTTAEAQEAATRLASIATQVGSQGYPARQLILIQVPPNMNNVFVGTTTNGVGHEIIFLVGTSAGPSYVTAYTPVNVSGYLQNMLQPGTYLVNVSAKNFCPSAPSLPCVYITLAGTGVTTSFSTTSSTSTSTTSTSTTSTSTSTTSTTISCSASPNTYSTVGGPYSVAVPANCGHVTLQLYGAGGGGIYGGAGGYITGTYAVTPGNTLYVYVGGADGTNGGATGGYENGGGCSAASASSSLSSSFIVAAGGGGGGWISLAGTQYYCYGGAGGGTSGTAGGSSGGSCSWTNHGGGGTQSGGGSGGVYSQTAGGNGAPGTSYLGGAGSTWETPFSGGGGCGYYGGGGGAVGEDACYPYRCPVGGAGGGGSSWNSVAVSGVTNTGGGGAAAGSNGSVTLTWSN